MVFYIALNKYGDYIVIIMAEHKKIPSTAVRLSTAFCMLVLFNCYIWTASAFFVTFHCFRYCTVNKSVQALALLFGVGFDFVFVAFGYSDFYFIIRRFNILLRGSVLRCAVSCHYFTSTKYNITFQYWVQYTNCTNLYIYLC